jgi:hypothetical protein
VPLLPEQSPERPPPLPESEEGELLECENVIQRVISETSFEERILMVGDILGEELPTVERKSVNFVRSVGEEDAHSFKRLPASVGFESQMQEYMKELGAEEGSLRARFNKAHSPYVLGKLPSRQKLKMNYYEIAKCPWSVKAPPPQSALYNSHLYKGSNVPSVYFSMERLVDWENMSRENVSVLSHLDHFVAAGSKLFRTMMERLESEEKVDEQDMWNMSRMGICMMHLAGMAVQDLAKNSMWQLGEQVTTRRDQFLDKMRDRVPPHELLRLRCTDINGPHLFDSKLVGELDKVAEVRQTEKRQTQVLNKALSSRDDQRKQTGSSSQSYYGRGDKKFTKTSFRGAEQAEYGQGRQSQTDQKSTFTPGSRGTGRGRGGPQRGQGRGRGGRFTPKKFGN